MRKSVVFNAVVCSFLFLIFSCKGPDRNAPATSYIDTTGMDLSVRPGDNFYLYVNGKWIRDTKIPPTESMLGGFMGLYNSTQVILHKILDSVSAANNAPGSIEQKVGDFYASGMDSGTIEQRGIAPLQPYLDKIAAIGDAKGIMDYATLMQRQANGLLYSVSIQPDDKNSSENIAAFGQAGLGLPDRDYYFKKDTPTLKVVQAYMVYGQTMLRLIGGDSVKAAARMAKVYELEKEMAGSHKTNVAMRDPQSNYHKVSLASLDAQMPLIGWKRIFDSLGVHVDSVNLQQPDYYAKLNQLLKTRDMETWRDYLRLHSTGQFAGALGKAFVDARFDYTGKALSGQMELKPRWDRVVRATDAYLGEGLGQVYVKSYFTADAKKRMLELVNNLQAAFDARIGRLEWMSDSTKAVAKDKLHAFLKKIGYPDKWKDYSRVVINKNTYFENRVSCSENEFRYEVSKLGKPVDRTEWIMSPPTVNAYYNPLFNEIVFPAGILQPPFFNPGADDAVNYGAIGMIIGHEMTHGFDDQGAQYNKEGNLKNWWGKGDSIKFVALTKKVIHQYNEYVGIDTFHVNGALTNGENIADMGGLAIAYDAFKLTAQGQDTTRIDGLTPDQRFFFSNAYVWRSIMKDEINRNLLATDPHSPDKFRNLGPLSNFEPFYAAFGVKPGDKMYRPEDQRIKIW